MRAYVERNPTAHVQRRPLSTYLLASVFPVVFACLLILAAPGAWRAMQAIGETHPTLASCAAITDSAGRLACYDQVEKDAMRPPAKGANALLASH
jgi:hypothetical protein